MYNSVAATVNFQNNQTIIIENKQYTYKEYVDYYITFYKNHPDLINKIIP